MDMLGIVAGTAAVGMIAYAWMTRKRKHKHHKSGKSHRESSSSTAHLVPKTHPQHTNLLTLPNGGAKSKRRRRRRRSAQ
jgi:uncharacterized membrane protein YebE (DUF533 family)